MEQVPVVDLAIGHLDSLRIGLSNHSTVLDSAAGHRNRPRRRVVIAPITRVDLWGPAKLGHHNHQGPRQQSPLGEIVEEVGERPVDVGHVVQVELKVVVMKVPAIMTDLDERHLLLDQPTSQQQLLAKLGLTVAVTDRGGFVRNVEQFAAFHQSACLFEGLGVSVNLGRLHPPTMAVVGEPTPVVTAIVGLDGESLGKPTVHNPPASAPTETLA